MKLSNGGLRQPKHQKQEGFPLQQLLLHHRRIKNIDRVNYLLKMKTELYKAIKAIDIKNLNDDDKEELLRMFMVTKNDLIRNHISFIFADLHYNKAVPYIIKKISDKSTVHNNGSLVYSLQDMDVQKYFIDFIKIICEQEYEPRLMAYEVVHKLASSIPNKIRSKALKILEDRRVQLERSETDKGENSTLHFVEKTKELLQSFGTSVAISS